MNPDNPALAHQLRSFSSNYLDTVRHEISAGIEFWKRLGQGRPASVRMQSRGVMYAMYQISDERLIQTNYCLARATANSPTYLAPSGDHAYRCARADFEWLWDHADPV